MINENTFTVGNKTQSKTKVFNIYANNYFP